MPPKKKIFHKDIKSIEEFEEITNNTEKGPLVIMDVYLSWCGPCACMVPNYPSIWFSYDDPESRLSFYQCSEEFVPEELLAELKLSIKPCFLIYHQGKQLEVIKGAKYVDLTNAIDKYVPEGPDD